MNETLLYIGSAIIILWGIAHIIPTRTIVDGFGDISEVDRKVITMELIAEGLTLIFLGIQPPSYHSRSSPLTIPLKFTRLNEISTSSDS